jgi:hypothetical protein
VNMAQASGTNENVMAASRNCVHLAASSPGCLGDPQTGALSENNELAGTTQAA